jgi:hypothetical protein
MVMMIMTQITIIILIILRTALSLILLTIECLNFWDFREEVEVPIFSAFWDPFLGLQVE